MLKRLLLGGLIAAFICASLGVAVADTPPELSEAQTMPLLASPPAQGNLSWLDPDVRREHGGTDDTDVVYDREAKGWKLIVSGALDSAFMHFQVTLPRLIPLQFALTVKAKGQDTDAKNCPLQIHVNSGVLYPQKFNGKEAPRYNRVPGYHRGMDDNATLPLYWDIPQNTLKPLSDGKSTNTIIVELYREYRRGDDNYAKCSEWLITHATIIPKKVYSSSGKLTTQLDAQFALTHSVGGTQDAQGKPVGSIWTRGFGLAPNVPMIPAPTLYFKPGDKVSVTLNNYLNPVANPELEKFLNQSGQTLSVDDMLDTGSQKPADHLRHEVNIPHNLNNTNLHVHGLHVDPSKDDVTIVITPGTIPGTDQRDKDTADAGTGKAGSTRAYDAPKGDKPDPTDLNPGSVSDQSVKYGNWEYVYRIPEHHLPGTHWYHPHKHGATAAQVENGMAGSIVIQESRDNAVVPFPNTFKQPNYNRAEWESNHDQVFVIQEILNYGLQLGQGDAKGKTNLGGVAGLAPNQTDVTVNGDFQPTRSVQPGQLERWRFINAGANHKAFSHIWLGKNTGETDKKNCRTTKQQDCAQKYVSAPMTLVAVDGIPLPKPVDITAEKPLLLGPGNRADVLVKFKESEKGSYAVFKNFPISFENDRSPIISVVDSNGKTILRGGKPVLDANGKIVLPGGKDAVFKLRSAVTASSNPYLFPPTGIQTAQFNVPISVPDQGLNYTGFQQPWKNYPVGYPRKDGCPKPNTSVFPLIRVKENIQKEQVKLLDVQFPLATDLFPEDDDCLEEDAKCGQWWQPLMDPAALDGGFIIPQLLVHVRVEGNTVRPENSPKMPTNDDLARVSPAGGKQTYEQIPAYVKPVKKKDILQSRPVIFDISGVKIQVDNKNTQNAKTHPSVSQFTLNGRYFTLSDPIGNQKGQSLLQRIAVKPTSDPDVTGGTDSTKGAPDTFTETMKLVHRSLLPWADLEKKYWVNPGYFLKIKRDDNGQLYYDDTGHPKPTWADYSGIPDGAEGSRPAVVNPGYLGGNLGELATKKQNGKHIIPGQPVNKTAEQWILINNSPVSHPFHIHINPFFVTEIGQLSYEQFEHRKEWIIRAISVEKLDDKPKNAPNGPIRVKSDSPMEWMVGTWWDTIVVPPHGYVKLNYWINVPYQKNDDTVEVNSNAEQGIWVYHCHILRHEDRGMMMPVVTQINPNFSHPRKQ